MKKLLMFLCCVVIVSPAMTKKLCNTTICPRDDISTSGVCDSSYHCAEYIRASVGSNQCYSCDSDDYGIGDDQCDYGKIVGQKDADERIIGVYRCTDTRGAWDSWLPYQSTIRCKNSDLVEPDPNGNSNKYYLLQGLKSKDIVTGGDHTSIPAGYDNCVYYVCKDGYAPSADKKSCVPTNKNCPITTGGHAATGHTLNNQTCTPLNPQTGLTSSAHVKDMTKSCNLECVAGGWNATLVDGGCNDGYVVSSNKKFCDVPDTTKDACAKSGGTWDAKNITCDCSKKGTNYEWDESAKQCKLNAAGRRAASDAAARKKACTDTGGAWNGGKCVCSSKHLEPLVTDRTCKCISGYVFEGGVCVITNAEQRRQICDSAGDSGAHWSDVNGRCICDGDNETFNYDTRRCEQDPEYAKCKSARNTRWENGICVCTQLGYEWTGEKCEESAESIAAREEAARKQRVTKSSAAIESASKKLDEIMAGLKISVWKTSEGNFNGARLASDSIAGVVLGTAGGLITSNVVKKNQVKTGFEDISCTVGGQRVADWGDEFTVGIR